MLKCLHKWKAYWFSRPLWKATVTAAVKDFDELQNFCFYFLNDL